MGLTIQVIVTGLSIGAVYGLFAICISVLYRLTGVVHLALGELAGVCVFGVLWLSYGRNAVAGTDERLPFLGGALLAIAATGGLGAAVYVVAIRPFLRRGLSLGWIGGVVAAAITLRGLVEAMFPRASYTLTDPLALRSIGDDGLLSLSGGATLQARVIVVGLVVLALAALTDRFLLHSRWGAALRAISEDRLAAALNGVPIEKALLLAFAGAAALAGTAAVIAVPGSIMTVNTGTLLGLKGLVAAVAGKFGRPRAVLLAGLALGVLETAISVVDLGPLELGASYRDVIPIALVLVLMALYPARPELQEGA